MDEAIKERTELHEEIKHLQKEGHISQVSGIIGKYMENGLYDRYSGTNGYKTHSRSSSVASQHSYSEPEIVIQRPSSPVRNNSLERSRNLIPVSQSTPMKYNNFSSSVLSPVRPSTPVDSEDEFYDSDYEYDDTPPTVPSHFREIYPHRKTTAYRSNANSSVDTTKDRCISPSVLLDDMEVQQLMNQSKVPKVDFVRSLSPLSQSSQRYGGSRSPRNRSPSSRRSNYSPFRNQSLSPERHDVVESIVESPIDKRFRDENCVSPGSKDLDMNENNKFYIDALNTAVKQENGKCRLFNTTDPSEIKDILSEKRRINRMSRSQSPSTIKGILKHSKSDHNSSIRNESPTRPYFSHSVSPCRSPRNLSPASPLVTSGVRSVSNNKQSYGRGRPSQRGSSRPGFVKSSNDLFGGDNGYRVSAPHKSYDHSPM